MTWDEAMRRYGADKSADYHGYADMYESFVGDAKILSVLEIGVDQGRSIRAWRDIFPDAWILGLDIRPECGFDDEPRITIRIADATKPDDVAGACGVQRFDLIVDDGSHQLHDTLAAADLLLPRLRPGGIYAVEDLPAGEIAAAMIYRLTSEEGCDEVSYRRGLQGWESLILLRKAAA